MALRDRTVHAAADVKSDRTRWATMSVFVWVMIGVAFWHLSVLVPDRSYGGIIGALLATVGGALLSGFLLPAPGIPPGNPPGVIEALWPVPGSLLALRASFLHGARRDRSARRPPHL